MNLYEKSHYSVVITGDFNSWHTSWGSGSSNRRGKILARYITHSRLTILNNGSATHYSSHGTFTNIDLTIISTVLAIHSHCEIETDLSGSDHFPMITSLFPNNDYVNSPNMRPRFNLKKAKWEVYKKLSENYSASRAISSNINKEAANIHKIILQTANESILQHKTPTYNHSVPWWSKKLETLKITKNHLWNKFKRNISTENELNFKRARSLYERGLKIAKRISIHAFTSEINPSTPTDKMWSNIRRFCGLKPKIPIHCIEDTNNPQRKILDSTEIANTGLHNLAMKTFHPSFNTLKIQ